MKLITNKSNIAITLIITLLLTACGDESEDSKMISIESKDEGKTLEINLPGMSAKVLKDKKGSLSLPEWLPENFPLPEGSQIIVAMGGNILIISANETVKSLANHFYTELGKDGWKSSSIIDEMMQVTYKKDKTQVIISINAHRKDKNRSEATMAFLFE